MRKLKIGYWFVVFVLLVLFFVQNQGVFMEKRVFSYNLISIKALADLELSWFLDYKTSEMYVGYLFIGFFLAGVVLTLVYRAFFVQLQLSSKVRFLNRTCESHLEKISALESELHSLRSGFPETDDLNIVDIPKESDSLEKKIN